MLFRTKTTYSLKPRLLDNGHDSHIVVCRLHDLVVEKTVPAADAARRVNSGHDPALLVRPVVLALSDNVVLKPAAQALQNELVLLRGVSSALLLVR